MFHVPILSFIITNRIHMQYAMVTMHWELGENLVNNFGINMITLQTKVFILERNKLMQITVHEMVALGLRGSCLCLSIYC